MARNQVKKIFEESISVKEKTLEKNADILVKVAKEMKGTLKKGGTIFFFGNGGSAADSQHIAAELVGRFQKERKALAAVALTTDTSILTALSNDYKFDVIFARQLEALGKRGDMAFGISTSGNSANVVKGIQKAKQKGLKTVTLTGNGGGKLARLSSLSMVVPAKKTARIQESHLCMLHTICELVEKQF